MRCAIYAEWCVWQGEGGVLARLRNVSLELRNVSFRLRNVSLRLRNVCSYLGEHRERLLQHALYVPHTVYTEYMHTPHAMHKPLSNPVRHVA